MEHQPPTIITSLANPRLKKAVKLRNSRERRRSGFCLVDGEQEISAAIETGRELAEIFVPLEMNPPATWITATVCHRVSDFALEKLSYGEQVRQPVAIMRTPEHRLVDLPSIEGGLLLVLDRIEKPGNLGACLRTAAACGVDAVVLNNPLCEMYNPNAIRASRGAIFRLPLAVSHTQELLEFAKSSGVVLRAARIDGHQSVWDCDWRIGTGVVFGNEAEGLGADWRQSGVASFHIPMHPNVVDSLNVSISAAVTLYEAVRQRSQKI